MNFKVQKIVETVKTTDETNTTFTTVLESVSGYTKVTVREHDSCSFKRGEVWSLDCKEEQKNL